jgi:hypothetical protein
VLHTLQPHSGGRPISQLSVGPEAALSLLVGQLVTDALTADPHHAPKNPEGVAMAIAGITAMQVSRFCLIRMPQKRCDRMNVTIY